ncbi:MAG: hypothetical protein JM58_02400 [Peptococcaceae bacterium BICA1-8]|nr:MAG: hypothetical protein JM58_02400 [Peptococcaceae bacterium BICA1-8]
MKDRFYNGFISGILGGLVSFVINFGSSALGLNTLVWADFMGLFILGGRPNNTLETAFFIGAQFVFLGLLGTVFSLIIPFITSKHHLFKGALFGASVWYLLFSLPYLFQLPELKEVPLKTVVSNLIAASLWGITMAYILKRIDSKEVHS